MTYLRVRNWEKWQSYRADRGQPPWIKVYRALLRDIEWISLSTSERGILVSLWLLAADKGGTIPDDALLLARLAQLDAPPDLERFIELGFLARGAKTTPRRRQRDAKAASA